jgi:cold-inducible RNA-binding protein
MSKKLYVGNLSYEVTEEDLSQLFNQCGQVSSAVIVKDQSSGRSKGYGFVEMVNADEATHAISRMQGWDLRGRTIQVNEAEERPDGAARPRGEDPGGGRRPSQQKRNTTRRPPRPGGRSRS